MDDNHDINEEKKTTMKRRIELTENAEIRSSDDFDIKENI